MPLVSPIVGSPHQAVAGQPAVPGLCRDVCALVTQTLFTLSHVRLTRKTFCAPFPMPLANVTPALTEIVHPPTLKYWVPLVHVPLAVTPAALS
jgi:hypothetical protein